MKRIERELWPPLAFALSVLVGFALLSHRQSLRDKGFYAPADKFQILKRSDAYHYQFRHLHYENGSLAYATELPAVFCPNYEPQLSAGQTLTRLHYQDLGRCWDIAPEGYGYSFETTDGVTPTLAPNCFPNNVSGLYECKPNKTEAMFEPLERGN